MTVSKFIFAADLHLSSYIWSGRSEIRNDAYHSLQQIADLCLSHEAPLYLGGDLFDKQRPEPASVEVMCRQLDRMQAAGLAVYYSQGQHELSRTTPWLSVHPWPVHLHRAISTAGAQIYGLDWQPASQLPAELAAIPAGTTFLMCHQVWREHMGEHIPSEGRLCDIPHVRYVLTGDFHVQHQLELRNKQGEPMRVLSPGSTCLRSITEDWQKYVFLCENAQSNGVGWAFLPQQLRTRGVWSRSVMDAPALEVFVDHWQDLYDDWNQRHAAALHPELPTLLYISYNPDVPEIRQRLEWAVNKRGLAMLTFFKAVEQQSWAEVAQEAREQLTTGHETLISAIPQLAVPGSDECEGALRILRSPNRAEEIKTMFEEHMRQ